MAGEADLAESSMCGQSRFSGLLECSSVSYAIALPSTFPLPGLLQDSGTMEQLKMYSQVYFSSRAFCLFSEIRQLMPCICFKVCIFPYFH